MPRLKFVSRYTDSPVVILHYDPNKKSCVRYRLSQGKAKQIIEIIHTDRTEQTTNYHFNTKAEILDINHNTGPITIEPKEQTKTDLNTSFNIILDPEVSSSSDEWYIDPDE